MTTTTTTQVGETLITTATEFHAYVTTREIRRALSETGWRRSVEVRLETDAGAFATMPSTMGGLRAAMTLADRLNGRRFTVSVRDEVITYEPPSSLRERYMRTIFVSGYQGRAESA